MTPNLEQLFIYPSLPTVKILPVRRLSHSEDYALWDQDENNIRDFTIDERYAIARRLTLLATHGQALIEALEGLLEGIDVIWPDLDCDHAVGICACGVRRNIEAAQHLLATLEHDAKGPQ